jgi:hypothetical protein
VQGNVGVAHWSATFQSASSGDKVQLDGGSCDLRRVRLPARRCGVVAPAGVAPVAAAPGFLPSKSCPGRSNNCAARHSRAGRDRGAGGRRCGPRLASAIRQRPRPTPDADENARKLGHAGFRGSQVACPLTAPGGSSRGRARSE